MPEPHIRERQYVPGVPGYWEPPAPEPEAAKPPKRGAKAKDEDTTEGAGTAPSDVKGA